VTKTNRRSPRVAGVLAGLAALCAALLLAAGCGDDGADLPDGVVARVGDAAITEAQLTETIEQSRAEAEAQGSSLPEEGAEGYDDVRRQALQQLVQQRVVSFEARQCGTPCKVTPKDITAELDRIRDANFEGSQEQFDEFLEDRDLTAADARAIVRSQLEQQALFNRYTRGVRFTAADAREYYDENRSQFTVPAGRTARHILVETKAEADAIRARVTPANFGEIAEAESTDTGSAAQGGDLGQIQKGQLVPEFEKVAFELADGEISQPVKTQFGWHIITVDITPRQTTSFAEARSQIISSQLAQKRQTTFQEWSEKVLEEWADRTVYADDDLRPETTATPATPAPTP
jgi:parvulin-like peptidyl-prolyl isomerase